MKIAFGIPFRISKYVSALSLCLNSIKRYAEFEYEVFIFLDSSREEDFNEQQFDYLELNISFLKKSNKRGYHKQTLINWIASDRCDIDYLIILHSDVFFYKSDIFPFLIEPLLKNNDAVASYWEVPFCLYSSTFHINEDVKKSMYVAPRVSSWCMCLNLIVYRNFIVSNPLEYGLFEAIHDEQFSFYDRSKCAYNDWIKLQPEYQCLLEKPSSYFMDVSSFLKFQIDSGNIRGYSLGRDGNPSFRSCAIEYRPHGYVHLEQFTPDRYNDIFYQKKLFDDRDAQIKKILFENYKLKI